MERDNYRWDDVKVFLSLMQERHFAPAGRRVGVSASTALRRLERLESALGAKLFVRTPEELLPTELAYELQPLALQLAENATRVRERAKKSTTQVKGTVRLAAPEAIGVYLIAPALPRLYSRYPEIKMEVVVGASLTDLMRREADLAIRYVWPTAGDVVVKKLASLPFAAFGSPPYLAELGDGSSSEPRWVTWVDELSERLESRWHAQHVAGDAVVRTDHALMGIAAAQAGAGLVLLPLPFGRLIPSLEYYPMTPKIEARAELWLASHVDLRRSPRVEAAWDWLVERVEEALQRAGDI